MIKYAPIATKHNNRFRGPYESYKDVAFESDLIYNIEFLKEKVSHFESELNHINKIVKSNNGMYNDLSSSIINIKHIIREHNSALDKKR